MKELIFKLCMRIGKWAKRGSSPSMPDEIGLSTGNSPTTSREMQTTVQCNISVRPAMNGKVLELAQWVPSVGTGRHLGSGGEWRHSLYIVPEGESISDAVTVLLVTQSLK
jgi:hypothetical protein